MSIKFFGKEGITSTSANHLANIAKEYLTSQHAIIDNISFVNETVSVNGSAPVITRKGIESTVKILPAIDKIGLYHAFIAYLREAIKAKKAMLDNIDTFSMYWNKYYSDYVMPDRPVYSTFNDILATKTIKEQAEYYRLEALASSIGKMIHPGGSYHTARTNAYHYLSHPSKVDGVTITSVALSLDVKEIDDTYFELQKIHRQTEARLNAFKNSIQTQIDNITVEKDKEYQKEVEKYTSIRQKAQAEYNLWYTEERKRISSLKIIIPHDLEETYEFFSKL